MSCTRETPELECTITFRYRNKLGCKIFISEFKSNNFRQRRKKQEFRVVGGYGKDDMDIFDGTYIWSKFQPDTREVQATKFYLVILPNFY